MNRILTDCLIVALALIACAALAYLVTPPPRHCHHCGRVIHEAAPAPAVPAITHI